MAFAKNFEMAMRNAEIKHLRHIGWSLQQIGDKYDSITWLGQPCKMTTSNVSRIVKDPESTQFFKGGFLIEVKYPIEHCLIKTA